MQGYMYDPHVHTSEASACASMSASEQVHKYKEAGYDGIFVTNHFFGGNTSVDRSLPWKEKIEKYCLGYEYAKEEGDKIGLKVFFGIEQGFHGTDILIYGISKEWLIEHSDMQDWDIPKTYEEVKKVGGIMVHAHPYREASYLNKIELWPAYVDAVETWNRGNKYSLYNLRAEEYAQDHDLPQTGGGDTHNPKDRPAGIITANPLNSEKDYMNLLLEHGDYELLKIMQHDGD